MYEIATIAAYLVAVVGIGLWTQRREAVGDFLIAGRSAGVLLTTASLAAVAGALVIAAIAEFSFQYGASGFWGILGDGAALAVLGLVAGRIRSLAEKHKFLTLTDYLFLRFGDRAGYLGFGLTFAGFLCILAAQFIVGGRLFAALTPLEYPVAVLVMGVFTLLYVMLGGFKAVIRTDLLQCAVMFLVFVVLVPLNIDFASLDLELDFGRAGPLQSTSLFVSAFVSLFIGADIWQRIYSARSARVAKTSLLLAGLAWVVLGVPLTLLGIAAREVPGATAKSALFVGLFELLPGELAGVAAVAVLAALMSTIDTEVFLLSSMITKDLLARRREMSEGEMASVMRRAMVGVAVPAMLMAILWPSVLGVLFVLFSLQTPLFPAITMSLVRDVSHRIAFTSMLVGALSIAPAFLLADDVTAPLVVLLASAIVAAANLFRRSDRTVES